VVLPLHPNGLTRGCATVVAVALISGCAAKRPAPAQPAPSTGTDLIVLLPDPGTGSVGRADVSTSLGQVTLDEGGEGTRVSANAAPPAPTILDEQDIATTFGSTLASLPLAPQHFTLYFQFDSEALTDESRLLLQQVLSEVRTRPAPEVTAIGHTDRTGEARANVVLGLRRANAVRTILVMSGLPASEIEVVSHGEAELLVPTADGVFEPRNRRVEVTVR